ncbi:MAG: hypothetical protein ACI9YU_001703 [Flavobacteriales bacterium]|jgi:hypothetical protein
MRLLYLSVLLFAGFLSQAQNAPILSDQAQISLLTCGPGKDIYEAFGHTAIRVLDEPNDLDFAFNYGSYDFNQPNFYLNFVKGRLMYMLSVSRTTGFVNYYQRNKRQVTEQILDLTQIEKQKLMEILDLNIKPENKAYLYDYFYDNCSTRPRDVVFSSLIGVLSMDTANCENQSIRQLTNEYLGEEQAWGRLGINICLSGKMIDQPTSAWEYMYLPEELMKSFAESTVTRNGEARPLVQETIILTQGQDEAVVIPWYTPKKLFVGLLLLIAAGVTMLRVRSKSARILEGSVFMLFGILSLVFLFLWIATEHFTAHNPFSLLWAVPTHLVFGWVLFKRNRPIWIRWYSVATAVLMSVVLAGWSMLPIEFLSEVRFLVILQLFLAIGIIRSGARKPILD